MSSKLISLYNKVMIGNTVAKWMIHLTKSELYVINTKYMYIKELTI